YFRWQWVRDLAGIAPRAQTVLAIVFLALGLYGGALHWRHDRHSFWFFGPLIFTVTIGLVYYLNFKYGASQAPELGENVPREVRDRDYFYLWSFSAWGVWAALGLVGVWYTLAELVARQRGAADSPRPLALPRRAWAFAAPVLELALIPLEAN